MKRLPQSLAAEWKSNSERKYKLITNVINDLFIKFVCNYNIILTNFQPFYSIFG
nr:MAG TPA: hypothetical protein [Caudoviricetes sp.]